MIDPCDDRAYLIAEIGINHNGSFDTAIDLIDAAADARWDAVKFQKRCLTPGVLFTQEELDRPYSSPNAFAATYGEHKAVLEFSIEQLAQLKEYAHSKDLQFGVSPWDLISVQEVAHLGVDFMKVPSACNVWVEYLRSVHLACRDSGYTMIVSAGMSGQYDVTDAMSDAGIDLFNPDVRLLHCTSSYPTPPEEINLRCLSEFLYSGISGHWKGIAYDVAAYALGAQIIERHITLDRTMKGSDHSASLEPQGMIKLRRDLDNVCLAMGDGEKKVEHGEVAIMKKLRTEVMNGK